MGSHFRRYTDRTFLRIYQTGNGNYGIITTAIIYGGMTAMSLRLTPTEHVVLSISIAQRVAIQI